MRVPPGTWRGYEAGPDGLEFLVIGAPNLGEAQREDVDGQRDWWVDTAPSATPSTRRERPSSWTTGGSVLKLDCDSDSCIGPSRTMLSSPAGLRDHLTRPTVPGSLFQPSSAPRRLAALPYVESRALAAEPAKERPLNHHFTARPSAVRPYPQSASHPQWRLCGLWIRSSIVCSTVKS